MGRSLLAVLLLIVLFLGLALIIVMFGIMPALTHLTQGPTPRPVIITAQPGELLSPATAERPLPRPATSATARPVPAATASAVPLPTPEPTAAAAVLEMMLQSEAAGSRYRFSTLATYGFELPHGEPSQITLRVEGEVDGQNVRQVLGTTERLPESRFSQLETRTVDGITYLYANGQWQVTAGDPSDAQQQFFQRPVDLADASVRLEPVGVEQLADAPVPTYRYRIHAPAGQMSTVAAPGNVPQGEFPSIEAQQSGDLWVGTDGRRYRMEYSIRLRVPQEEMLAGWELVTRYYDYDDPTIRVEAPSGP